MFAPAVFQLRACLCECSCLMTCFMEPGERRCDTCDLPICLDCMEAHHAPFCAAVAAGVTAEDIEDYERSWS